MPRYIDANQFNNFDYEKFDGPLTEDAVQGIETVLREIDQAPTVDAVEVVRCKDCEYFLHYRCSADNSERMDCRLNGLCFGEYDYCSCGKKRGDGK